MFNFTGPLYLEGATFQWNNTGTTCSHAELGSTDFSVGPMTVAFEPGLHLICGTIASGKTLMLLGEAGS